MVCAMHVGVLGPVTTTTYRHVHFGLEPLPFRLFPPRSTARTRTFTFVAVRLDESLPMGLSTPRVPPPPPRPIPSWVRPRPPSATNPRTCPFRKGRERREPGSIDVPDEKGMEKGRGKGSLPFYPRPLGSKDPGVPDGTFHVSEAHAHTCAFRFCFTAMHRSSSSLDVSGASIVNPGHMDGVEEGNAHERRDRSDGKEDPTKGLGAPSIALPNQNREFVPHLALDIGGSLVKMVYFAPSSNERGEDAGTSAGGQLHFVKFETNQIHRVVEFIASRSEEMNRSSSIRATGGGAFKYAELFRSKLGMILVKEDEMTCLVTGAVFLLRSIRDEAFTFFQGEKSFVKIPSAFQEEKEGLFPFLLVSIGSGVSMIRVDGDKQYERVSGTSIGGGTFWGLCRLLTGCENFDEMLQMSSKGDNAKVDMLVGDIYGGRDYASHGLSASTIASSFGKVACLNLDLPDYNKADLALSLLRLIAYNIAQIAYLNAMRFGVKRVFFGGFFIRGHTYTMETISFAIDYFSKGTMKALYLRHEGFLGAVGAFLMNEQDREHLQGPSGSPEVSRYRAEEIAREAALEDHEGGTGVEPSRVRPLHQLSYDRSHFVERFPASHTPPSSLARGEMFNVEDAFKDSHMKSCHVASDGVGEDPQGLYHVGSLSDAEMLRVGVLHVEPRMRPFPLIKDELSYVPDTLDLASDSEARNYWIDALLKRLPSTKAQAISSDMKPGAVTRGEAFATAFAKRLLRLKSEPSAYGRLSLAVLLEAREDCLREFGFRDAYCNEKKRESEASVAALPHLLQELDLIESHDGESLEGSCSYLSLLIQGVLAGNLFDWGAAACDEIYSQHDIISSYQAARERLGNRPWRVDQLDDFCSNWNHRLKNETFYHRAVIFCDNSGADVVLGVLPFARALLRLGADVVLAANTSPAVNDITSEELSQILGDVAGFDREFRKALEASKNRESAAEKRQPHQDAAVFVIGTGAGGPCIDLSRVSCELCDASESADLVVLIGMGRAIHTNLHAKFSCDSLKLAMVKNKHLAETLFGGNLFDCVCAYEQA
eukprot:scaffold2636_cov340-Pavlova_lutheri.AAC.148